MKHEINVDKNLIKVERKITRNAIQEIKKGFSTMFSISWHVFQLMMIPFIGSLMLEAYTFPGIQLFIYAGMIARVYEIIVRFSIDLDEYDDDNNNNDEPEERNDPWWEDDE